MPDESRFYTDLTEPFMVTMRMRELGEEGGKDVKIVWWYIAVLDDDYDDYGDDGGNDRCHGGEEEFTAEFFPLEEAVRSLAFRMIAWSFRGQLRWWSFSNYYLSTNFSDDKGQWLIYNHKITH